MANSNVMLEGSNCLRQRIALATFSGKPIIIENIREKDENPGIREYEAVLFKLVEKITNGSTIIVDQSGTRVAYKPGVIHGGNIEHDCGLERSITYYLEFLFLLAPFCKKAIEAKLTGITNDDVDVSVDALKFTTLNVVKRFLGAADNDELDIKIISRGLKPNGGGVVTFKCPIRRYLRPVQILDAGKVKRIRGIAFATRVSPQIASRMVEVAKGICLNYLADVFISTDHLKGPNSGKSPGFGIVLVAETTNGMFYTGEALSNPSNSGKGVSIPEDIGREAAYALLHEIYRGGCVDSVNQGLACLFMAMGQPDLSKIEFGPLSPFTIQLLRHLKLFFEIVFKLDVPPNVNPENFKKGLQKVTASCMGIGFANLNKTVT